MFVKQTSFISPIHFESLNEDFILLLDIFTFVTFATVLKYCSEKVDLTAFP